MEHQKPIIFFDGVCNLCNGAINFIIDRDKKGHFKFAPLQSNVAKNYVSQQIINNTDSIILWKADQLYSKSTAALKIARHLDGAWKGLYVLIIIPKFIRDFVYDIIAKKRYKWFGKRDSCRMPTKDIKNRFLEMD
ncbi:DCC1-like thiol-disulfide oxidoreductase family protein [Marivirga salinae]|uniref:DCC1-like thiol-disulfide oxidoreductase family protein n=1 Tax=Marivirga salinarum TaxID=3059078 RepID=A0AA49JH34_9BACT|nr:DCC1-like thiol-disulfide oxidoreductase family protein [Marivirga sp. BDSF4-3]WKK77835.1 DCC1-like thiol-disulfide oxidoreductase family protein [Marivirga sp. BDSF4-3]